MLGINFISVLRKHQMFPDKKIFFIMLVDSYGKGEIKLL